MSIPIESLPPHVQERARQLMAQQNAPAPATTFGELRERDERIISDAERGRLEKHLEHEGDKIVLAIGGQVVRFSHAGRTKQTPGISDRLYCFPRCALAVWWEWKTPENAQSSAQEHFEATVTACGHLYRAGGLGDFRAWLAEQRVCLFDDQGNPVPMPA